MVSLITIFEESGKSVDLNFLRSLFLPGLDKTGFILKRLLTLFTVETLMPRASAALYK